MPFLLWPGRHSGNSTVTSITPAMPSKASNLLFIVTYCSVAYYWWFNFTLFPDGHEYCPSMNQTILEFAINYCYYWPRNGRHMTGPRLCFTVLYSVYDMFHLRCKSCCSVMYGLSNYSYPSLSGLYLNVFSVLRLGLVFLLNCGQYTDVAFRVESSINAFFSEYLIAIFMITSHSVHLLASTRMATLIWMTAWSTWMPNV